MGILSKFWRWWTEEIRVLLRRAGVRRLALDMAEDRMALLEHTRKGWRTFAAIAVDPETLNRDIRTLHARALQLDGGLARVDLILPSSRVLIQEHRFDSARKGESAEEALERNIKAAVRAITDYPRETLTVRTHALGRIKRERTQFHRVAIAHTETVEEALRCARSWRFAPRAVMAKVAGASAESWPDFTGAASTERAPPFLRLLCAGGWRLTGVAMLCALVLLAFGAWRAIETRAGLSVLSLSAGQGDRQNLSADALAHALSRPSRRHAEESESRRILAAFAHALGKTRTFRRLTFREGRIEIAGAHPEPGQLLLRLARALSLRELSLLSHEMATGRYLISIALPLRRIAQP